MDETRQIAKKFNSIKLDNYNDYLQEENDGIYHYTAPNTFGIIIKDNTLRFTDRLFLNDISEGSYVLEVCLKMIEKKLLEENIDKQFYEQLKQECQRKIPNPNILNFHTYQISFSFDKDNLALWNYYTKGNDMGGFNLKFNSKNLIKSLNEDLKESKKQSDFPMAYGGKVVYEKETQMRIVEDIISKFKPLYDQVSDKEHVVELLVRKILIIGTFFKKDCFKFENEYRIVLDLYLDDDGKFKTIDKEKEFFEKNGYLIPYVDLKWKQEALIGITVSPTLEFEGIKRSILNVTDGKYSNINDESIHNSDIPVRY